MSEIEPEIQIGDKKIGGNTLIQLNVKTITWIFAILYAIGGWFYFDLRKELKASAEISKEEKVEFMKEIEKEFDTKLDKMIETTHRMELEQVSMKGDIKVILDRTKRTSPEEQPTNAAIEEVQPPGSQ